MKIKLIDSASNQPLANIALQVQFNNRKRERFILKSDEAGFIELDDRFIDLQMMTYYQGYPSRFITLSNNIIVRLQNHLMHEDATV